MTEKNKPYSDNEFLWNQLIQLGDMLGDGLGYEPDGKWIGKEYKRVARELGLIKRKNHTKQINDFMEKRIKSFTCKKCEGAVKQTRSGSFRAMCINCGTQYVLGKIRKKRN